MALRKAKISDIKLFYNLRNQPDVRNYSENNKKIIYQQHKLWFQLNFKKKNNFFFVITLKSKDIGYLRVQKKEKSYYVSICIAKRFRRLNIAHRSLLELSKKMRKKIILVANVNKKNISSIILFIKSGFRIFKINKKNLKMKKKNINL